MRGAIVWNVVVNRVVDDENRVMNEGLVMVNEGAAIENVGVNEALDDRNWVVNMRLLWEMWELLPWGIRMPLLWQMTELLQGMRRLLLWGMVALGIRMSGLEDAPVKFLVPSSLFLSLRVLR